MEQQIVDVDGSATCFTPEGRQFETDIGALNRQRCPTPSCQFPATAPHLAKPTLFDQKQLAVEPEYPVAIAGQAASSTINLCYHQHDCVCALLTQSAVSSGWMTGRPYRLTRSVMHERTDPVNANNKIN